MRDKMVVPSVFLAGVVLIVGISLIAAMGAPEDVVDVSEPPAVVEEQGGTAPPRIVTATEPVSSEALEPALIPASNGNGKNGNGADFGSVTLPLATEALPDVGADDTLVPELQSDLIYLSLEDVELEKVVKIFTRIADVNIITSGTNLQGTVSVHLQGVPWQPALEAILAEKGLMLHDVGASGVYTIRAKAAGAPDPLFIETFFLQYASVPDVIEAVKATLDGRGRMSSYPSRNAMIVHSTKANLLQMKDLITIIDIPRRQVYIESKFMELNDVAIKNMGINWTMLQGYSIAGSFGLLRQQESYAESQNRAGTFGQTDGRTSADTVSELYDIEGERISQTPASTTTSEGGDATTTSPTDIPVRTISDDIARGRDVSFTMGETVSKSLSDVRTAVLSPFDFSLILSALKGKDGISIISNPKIIVANGEEALIHIGEVRRPFVASVTPGTEGSAPTIIYNAGDEVKFGVELNVTPTVNTASNITVMIEPVLTRSAGFETAPSGQTYPIVSQKKIKTLFHLESGRTAAIGGLTETEDVEDVKKVPLLGDIPLIGKYLFSHKSERQAQRETIIFVTVGLASPENITDNTGLPGDSELVHRQLIRSMQRKEEFQQELAAMRAAAKQRKEEVERRRKYLLKRAR
jgi:type II secretory pathway component GspD/PulD (secretin)